MKKNISTLMFLVVLLLSKTTFAIGAFTEVISNANPQNETIIPSTGFTLNGLLRGLLGMAVLILISYVFSTNRKAINWKTVSFGLIGQLILAIGVLKVPFIQSIFEVISKVLLRFLNSHKQEANSC